MANTTKNGATPAGGPGGNPLQTPGAVTGGNDPMSAAETALSQTNSALRQELEPKPLDSTERKHVLKLGKKRESMIGPWLNEAVAKPGLAPGRDPVALLAEFTLVQRIQALVPTLRGLSRDAEDTVLVRLQSLWQAVSDIYGVAQHTQGDSRVADLVRQMQSVLSPGPRKQKAKKTAITPIPQGKKAMKEALLAHAGAVQEPGGQASTVPPSQPASPAPAGTAPASGAPASNSGTPSSGHSS